MKEITVYFLCIVLVLLIVKSSFAQGSWVQQSTPVTTDINSIWSVDNNTAWACGYFGALGLPSVVRTINGGMTWSLANGGLPTNKDFYSIFAINANTCWIGTDVGTIYRTTNGGTNWTQVVLPPPTTTYINAIHFFDVQKGFVLGDPNATGDWRYYVTTNGGNNWTFMNTIPSGGIGEAGWNNSYCALDTGHIWFGTSFAKVYRGSFMGNFSWSSTLGTPNVFGLSFFNSSYGLAVEQNNLIKSTNGGVNWEFGNFTPTGGPSAIKVFNINSGLGWICTRSSSSPGKIYRTSNAGVNWTEQTTTLASGKSFTCISMNSVNNGWAGTGSVTMEMRMANKRMITDRGLLSNGGIYKYSDNITIAGNENSFIPANYELKRNYPNPFNPSTKIEYSVPANELVTIKVFDIMGREISALVNEYKNAGSYSVSFNGNNLSSGIYFLKMKAGSFEQTRTMNLIK
jgi:photosystem II stability/assembly factor-like uncharacterized protein